MRRALFTLSLLVACQSSDPPRPAASTAAPVPRSTEANDQVVDATPGFVGVVLPSAAVDVAPAFEGKLDTIDVAVGETVARGQSVATFDPTAAREALEMAKAELRTAKGQASEAAASARHAARKLKTDRELYQQGILAEQSVDDSAADRARAGAATTTAGGRIAAAKARIEQLERQLEDTSLAAPFAGTVSVVYLEAGALANARKPVLRLIGNDGAFVRFAVPPAELATLTLGSVVQVSIEDEDVQVQAVVRKISPEVDAPTGLVFLEAEVAGKDAHRVRPNSKAWVRTS